MNKSWMEWRSWGGGGKSDQNVVHAYMKFFKNKNAICWKSKTHCNKTALAFLYKLCEVNKMRYIGQGLRMWLWKNVCYITEYYGFRWHWNKIAFFLEGGNDLGKWDSVGFIFPPYTVAEVWDLHINLYNSTQSRPNHCPELENLSVDSRFLGKTLKAFSLNELIMKVMTQKDSRVK